MNVIFEYTNGRKREMLERDAKILTKLRKGRYLTRDMANVPMLQKEADSTVNSIEEMDRESLKEYAKSLGIRIHHMAGADKIRDAIREHQKDQ